MSIKNKISLIVSILFGIIIAIASIISIKYIQQLIESNIVESHDDFMRVLTDTFDRQVISRHNVLIAVTKKITPSLVEDPIKLQKFIEDRASLSVLFTNILVYAPDGTVLAAYPDPDRYVGSKKLADMEYVHKTVTDKVPYISKMFISPVSGEPVIVMTSPIFDETGDLIAFMGGSQYIMRDNLFTSFTSNTLGKSGVNFLMTPDRVIIAHSDKSRLLEKLDVGANPALEKALTDGHFSGETTNSMGVKGLISSRAMKSTGWLATVFVPLDEAYEPIKSAQLQITRAIIVLLMILPFLVWLSMDILTRPLLVLRDKIRGMTLNPQTDELLLFPRKDEIGELAEAFNSLTVARRGLEEEKQRLNRALRLLSDCSQLMIKAEDEPQLLAGICQLILDVGGYPFSWVGYEDETDHTIKAIARSADPSITIDPQCTSRPALDAYINTALKTGNTQIFQMASQSQGSGDFMDDPGDAFSGIVLPLKHEGIIFGVLCILDRDVDAFNPIEAQLMEELSLDLGFGISVLRSNIERKATQKQLKIAATAFEAQEGIIITDSQNIILKVNQSFCRITGYSAHDVIGQTPDMLKSQSRDESGFDAEAKLIVVKEGAWQGENWGRRKDGEEYPEWLSVTAIKNDDGIISHYVYSLMDISSDKAAEAEIQYLAFYDPLTQLPNRRLLMDRLQQTLVNMTRIQSEGVLMFIDLDNFKMLNDIFGHDAGDVLLQQVAERLTQCVRESDTVARWGGDEFVVLLHDQMSDDTTQALRAKVVANKILTSLNQAFTIKAQMHFSTPSIGATVFHDGTYSADELLKQADLAMYQAKAAGRNTVKFFDPKMQLAITARSELEADFRNGIDSEQFLLYYQPQVDDQGKTTGAEALIRWLHPQRGLVSPLDFIPLSEETGLIVPLGHWVLETACKHLASWAKIPEMASLSISVNVSAKQFRQSDFVDQVLKVLQTTGANPQRLKLELTESMLLDNVEDIIVKMSTLKTHGLGFSLDDFGTGYSSLSYLKRLPLFQLKIDKSFVRDVLSDPNDATIVRTIISLGQNLGLRVIAEGVENLDQQLFLAEQGCFNYQGFLYNRPMAEADFRRTLCGDGDKNYQYR